MLDRKIFFDLSVKTHCLVGRKNPLDSSYKPEIILSSVGIQIEHAVFETDEYATTLRAISESALPFITVNGEKIDSLDKIRLRANDRIIFGTSVVFLFKHEAATKGFSMEDSLDDPITFEFAMQEKSDKENIAEPTIIEDEEIKKITGG